MAAPTRACDKHRFSQFLPFWLHARVVAFVRSQKKKGIKTSVTEEIETLVYSRFSGKEKARKKKAA